jgi:MFS transporter, UMF1 family
VTRAKLGWALFDWSTQPFYTLITTFLFAPYFTSVVVGDSVHGQALWGLGQGAAGAAVALLSPVLGAVADATGRRKPWIAGFAVVAVVAMAALWTARPGVAGVVTLTLVVVAVATVAVEFATVFNNAMMPSLVPQAALGRLSGFGWGLGYVGGLVALGLMLGLFVLPDMPAFGLSRAAHEPERLVGPFSAVWLAVFILPLFRWTPDAPRRMPLGSAVSTGLTTLGRTLGHLRRYRVILRFLVARMLYYDGLTAIFSFGGIYAAGLFHWGQTELGIFGIVIVVFAMAGAFIGGRLDDRLGSKATILISLAGLVLALLGILAIPGGQAKSAGLFATGPERAMLGLAAVIGLCAGPAQAASRTLMARLAPPELMTEFFGLYALSGKATAFAAPLAVSLATSAFANQRAGLAVLVVFLVIGGLLLARVPPEA